MKLKTLYCAAILGLTLSAGAVLADTDENIQIMIDAARQLTWDDWVGENPANLLVKQETIVAPVAVIFGYVDNTTACEAFAHALSQSQTGVGTFKCQPIF